MTSVIDPWAINNHDEAQALTPYTAPGERSHCREAEVAQLAVLQVADDRLRVRLRGAERDEAVRRMYGRVELHLIAWRLYTTTRTVRRIAARFGLTTTPPALN
ncbi:hypothetical protein MML61_27520 (plasmid) [Mycobacterium marinum]|uniref:hypothetical protein n=1 Tax=Mycobacterium marinum TaxID=1781 RepID=UPI00045FC9CD|nr:hypothetical protein [Mycobacterium marinum]WCS21165.1 hypothetical protein MML61_27520 [Mycobacterium marinum]WOR07522.1 hypothetical protein QDR78_27400 [Mycobacterium marinum]CDM79601.1 hypothetical protein MMARE11_p00990 [Mycobacterium marinum E11]BBC69098.1 hypothetical protein MMRN_p0670 [Mycobacterium marinum]GJO51781.1 hypothetical protein NJB1604_39970 [Mycobacterium marinum]